MDLTERLDTLERKFTNLMASVDGLEQAFYAHVDQETVEEEDELLFLRGQVEVLSRRCAELELERNLLLERQRTALIDTERNLTTQEGV